MSFLNASINRAITHQTSFEGRISLSDNVKQEEEDLPSDLDGEGSLSKKLTNLRTPQTGLRENLARRKYAKFQKDRYNEGEEDDLYTPGPSNRSSALINPDMPLTSGSARPDDVKSRAGKLRRGQRRVRGILGRKKKRRGEEGQSEIDILWENQRGWFLFGRPYYSSNSLLNFDPPPWTNVYNKPSATDITNAQCPDPHWEWSWKSWYVDMSLDVDEQGWQYSFMFQNRFPWHGTHPWGYSFARRRRWIRKRVRKHQHLPSGKLEGGQALKDAHRLNADYFTIHATATGHSPDSSYPPSTTGPQTVNRTNLRQVPGEEPEGIDNMKILFERLKRATVDREKINYVLRFVDEGGQDIHYLADEMSHIMSLFVYQYSRRHLLTALLRKIDPRDPADDKGKGKEKEKVEAEAEEDPEARRRKEDLQRAVEAADGQIKGFEFWSDISGIVQGGESLTAADGRYGWDSTWQGVDKSGPGNKANTFHNMRSGSSTGKEKAEDSTASEE